MNICMPKFILEGFIGKAASVMTLSLAILVSVEVAADDVGEMSSIKGEAVTGWNQRMGMPVTALNYVGELNFNVGGVCGETAAEPVGVDTPLDALMCTYADPPIYKLFFGIDVTDSMPENQNVVYRDYPQIVDPIGSEAVLPKISTVPWYKAANGAESEGLTVERWLKAKGNIRFICHGEKNLLVLKARHLVPGGLYTMWGFYFDQFSPPPPEGTGGLQPDLAFGGTSANVFVADDKGAIEASRDLGFCPQNWPKSEPFQLINLHLVYHPEGRVYGAVAHQVHVAPSHAGPGMVAIPQLMFAMP